MNLYRYLHKNILKSFISNERLDGMAVRIESKNKQPTEEELKKLKKYVENAETGGFKTFYSSNPDAVFVPLSKSPYEQKPTVVDVMTLLNMPDHLRKTAQNVVRLGRATADDVAEQTHRARAAESAYLNQLVIMGYLKKEREGRKAYFYVEPK